MAQVAHEIEVTDELVRLIKVDHFSTVGLKLKFIQMGAMEYLPLVRDFLSSNVPCVFVHPQSTDYVKATMGPTGRWSAVVHFRIVEVQKIEPGQDYWRVKLDHSKQLRATLFTAFLMTALSLTNAGIEDTRLVSVDFKPPEDNLAAGVGADLTATAILYDVHLSGIRNA